jgi:hypothetical protein
MAAKSAPKSAADKLAEQDANGTPTGANMPDPAKPADAKLAAKPKSNLTKAQLTKAATMRGEGATWNEIRAAFKVQLGSSAFFKAREREGIDHIPAGERVKPKPEANGKAAQPADPVKPKPKPTVNRTES